MAIRDVFMVSHVTSRFARRGRHYIEGRRVAGYTGGTELTVSAYCKASEANISRLSILLWSQLMNAIYVPLTLALGQVVNYHLFYDNPITTLLYNM